MMETVYNFKKLKRAGVLVAVLLSFLLTVPNGLLAQENGSRVTRTLELNIEGHGSVQVQGPGFNAGYIVGPTTATSTISNIPNGALVNLTVIPEDVDPDNYQFGSWDGPDAGDVEPVSGSVYEIVVDEDKTLDAIFQRILNVEDDITFSAGKEYDGDADADNAAAAVDDFYDEVASDMDDEDNITINWTSASYADKNVGTGKDVDFTGLSISGVDDYLYVLDFTDVTIQAEITDKELTVDDSEAQDKTYDGTTDAEIDVSGASLVGVVGTDDVSLVDPGEGTFSQSDVGTGLAVTPALALIGDDAGNYDLTQPDHGVDGNVLVADITAKELTGNFEAEDKTYDETTDATVVTGSLSLDGVVSPDVVSLDPGTATFSDQWPGVDKTVTMTGAGISGTDAGNYTLGSVNDALADIDEPAYAMFEPTYNVGRATDPVEDVPINTDLTIEFNPAPGESQVYDVNGETLPSTDLGDFVKIEVWDGSSWNVVPFEATRSGNVITLITDDDLAYDTDYRLRFLNIYQTPAATDQVKYTLDYDNTGDAFDATVPNALVDDPDNSVEFTTISLQDATLPTVTPFETAGVCDVIKVNFENPVEYLNGNQITDDPTHKFTLQYDDGGWTNVPSEKWEVQITDVVGSAPYASDEGPVEMTIVMTEQMMYNTQYRVKMNVGLDSDFGFTDKITGFDVMDAEFNFAHQDGTGWYWGTDYQYDYELTMNTVSTGFGSPDYNNVLIDGSAIATIVGGTLNIDNDHTADFTVPEPDEFEAVPSEGYHFVKWTKDGDDQYDSSTPPALIGEVYPFDVAEQAPLCDDEPVNYQANFAINEYTINGIANTEGTVTGGGDYDHGETANLVASPDAGYKFTGWDYTTVAGVNYTEDVTTVGPFTTVAPDAELDIELLGPNLVDGNSYDHTANFEVFNPKVWANAIGTDDGGTESVVGQIEITTILGQGGILSTGDDDITTDGDTWNYDFAEVEYETPVKLIPFGQDCEYEFVKWVRYVDGEWVDFSTEATLIIEPSVIENYLLQARFEWRDNVNVSATAEEAELGTVLLEDGDGGEWVNDADGAEFEPGEELTITVYPEPDYYTYSLEDGEGNVIQTEGDAFERYEDRSVWKYTVGCEDIDIKAIIDLKQYDVTVSANSDEGTVDASTPAYDAGTGFGFEFPSAWSGNGVFEKYTDVTYEAEAKDDYAFTHWEYLGSGLVASTDNPYTETITTDRDLVAKFESTLPPEPTFVLTLSSNPDAAADIFTGAGYYEEGEDVTVNVSENTGWEFVNWTKDGTEISTSQSFTYTTTDEDVELVANFEKIDYTLNLVNRTYLRNDPNPPYAQEPYAIVNYGGTVVDVTGDAPYNFGDEVTLEIEPNPGFDFVNWMTGEVVDPTNEIFRGEQINPAEDGTVTAGNTYQFTYTIPPQDGPVVDLYAIFVETTAPEYPVYNLTTESNPDGYGNTYGDGYFAHGVEAIVDQEPVEPGYEFDTWSSNVTTGGTPYVDMKDDEVAVANYVTEEYTLNVEIPAGMEYGSVTPTSTVYTVEDEPIDVTASAWNSDNEFDYHFDGWFYDVDGNEPVLDAGGNPIGDDPTFGWIPMVPDNGSDVTIYGHFSRTDRYYDITLETALGDYETLNSDVGTTNIVGEDEPYSFLYETELDIETTPNPGYEFQHWTNSNGTIIVEQTAFNHTVVEDKTFIAVYNAIEYTMTAAAETGGSVDPASQTYIIGDEVSVSATANTGYDFTGWNVVSGSVPSSLDLTSATLTFDALPNDVELLATFEAIEYTMTATSTEGGSVSPETETFTVEDAVTVTATADAGYEFVEWEAVSGIDVSDNESSVEGEFTFSGIADDVELNAVFEAIPYDFSVTADPGNGGTFSATEDTYTVGEEVSVTATAAAGFSFLEWTATGITLAADDTTGNVATFDMPANAVTLEATFEAMDNSLVGQVKYFNQFESNMPSNANFMVALYDESGNLVETTTVGNHPDQPNVNSFYGFDGVTPGMEYTLRIWEDDATLGDTWTYNNWDGVSAADALIISYMVAGNTIIADNFNWIQPDPAGDYTDMFFDVADVNSSESLTGADPLTVMYRSIGYPGTSPFPNNTFNFQVGGDQVAALGDKVYPDAPSEVFEQTGTYAEGQAGDAVFYEGQVTPQAGQTVFNIYYVSSGDVNASNVPQQGTSKAQQVLGYEDQVVANVGEEVNIPVRVEKSMEVGAMTLGFNYDNTLLEVNDVEGYEVAHIDHENGTVRVSAADQNGMSFNANDNVVVINATVLAPIAASSRYLELENITEFVDRNAETIADVNLNTVSLKSGNATSIGDGLATSGELNHQNFPNPFKEMTNIQYTLPEAGKVMVTVYDNMGREVKTLVDERQMAGEHKVEFSSNDANGSGVYMYRITVQGNSENYTGQGSIILLK